MQAGGHKNNI